MTPLECAESMVAFFKEKLVEYDEQTEKEEGYNVYAGYLPLVTKRDEMKALCPAIVVRPLEVNDGEKETTVLMGVYVTTYDEDKKYGCNELYHLLEFLRFSLLANDPVKSKWAMMAGTMTTSVPDDQPYPQWWGRIDFAVYLPQPKRTNSDIFW